MEAEIQILNVFYYRSVGKSSLAIQFVQGQFVDYYEPTIENTFNKTINIKGSVTPVVKSQETEVDCCPFQIQRLFDNDYRSVHLHSDFEISSSKSLVGGPGFFVYF